MQTSKMLFRPREVIRARCLFTNENHSYLKIQSNISKLEIHQSRQFSNPPTTGSNELRIGTDLLQDSLSFGTTRKIYFDGYSASGFDINGLQVTNGETVHVYGSCIAFPHTFFMWQPKNIDEVTPESLKLISLRKPRTEILLLGTERRMENDKFNELFRILAKQGTIIEQMDLVSFTNLSFIFVALCSLILLSSVDSVAKCLRNF